MDKPFVQFRLAVMAGWINRQQQEVIEYFQSENRILRERVGPGRLRFADAECIRHATAAKCIGPKGLAGIEALVTPDTLLRWYRDRVARKYEGTGRHDPGRPRAAGDIDRHVVRMATQNPGGGYTRIRGAIYNLRDEVARNTLKRILLRNGIDPAPERG